MATQNEYAQLSLYVYDATQREDNRSLLLAGWDELEYQPDARMGFSYGVFRRKNTNEVVIAFAGTNQGVDWAANVANGAGLLPLQAFDAALVYITAKRDYGSNITFAGHSLGGGLASVMAVWFDRPATVFDEAPFRLQATNPVMLPVIKTMLALGGYSDLAFTSYTGLLDIFSRERQVTHSFLEGEILQALRVILPSIGIHEPVQANIAGMVGPFDATALHSQGLLTAFMLSDAFRQSTYASARNDVLWGDGGNDDLFGGSGNDYINGDSPDVPLALQGDDYLDGEDGDDSVYGGGGNDQLFGGAGADTLFGEKGNDYLDGEDGADTLIGDEGNDQLFGGAGNDTIAAESGGDDVFGDAVLMRRSRSKSRRWWNGDGVSANGQWRTAA